MKLVIVESPYGSPDPAVVAENILYLRACLRFCLKDGVAPYASHAIYTQPGVLDDRDETERDHGIRAGFAWGAVADEVWVFTDRGVSKGMEYGIKRAEEAGQRVRRWKLGEDWARWLGPTCIDEGPACHSCASQAALDDIAKLCGAPDWEYPGQVVRDVKQALGM